jgi:hypothetical protein
VAGESVLWAETPDEDRDEAEQREEPGEVDESFETRRLRRWLKGMFGGKPAPKVEPPEREPEN